MDEARHVRSGGRGQPKTAGTTARQIELKYVAPITWVQVKGKNVLRTLVPKADE
jgi:hypothetical protein